MNKTHCPHPEAPVVQQVCRHLLQNADVDFLHYFTGSEQEYALICRLCAQDHATLFETLCSACIQCVKYIEAEGYWDGILGRPQIREELSSLSFQHRLVQLSALSANHIVDIQPLQDSTSNLWVGLTTTGQIVHIRLDEPDVDVLGSVEQSGVPEPLTALQLSPDGRLAALFNPTGNSGVIVELPSLTQRMVLQRDGYHDGVSPFPLAFWQHENKTLLIHSTAWNRLDISDPWNGQVLTEREPTSYTAGEQRPEHYLDYFHGTLLISPTHEWIVDDGWVWHPVGVVTSWNIKHWMDSNAWESEDGKTKKDLCQRFYFWGGPICWLDHRTVAVWGYGEDDEWMLPAVRLFDVVSAQEKAWFPGPDVDALTASTWDERFTQRRDALIYDDYLFSVSERTGVQVWDIQQGARLLHDASFHPIRYNRVTKEFLSLLPNGDFQLSRLVA